MDPNAVKTVLVASDSQMDDCVGSIQSKNGKVLFKSETGLLMTDLPPAALDSETCKATKSENSQLPLPKPANEPGAREPLSTILRLIPAEEIGARSFIRNNPSLDGRGVVVAVLDTGVELDHPMLSRTSAGERKVINANDFSGEGRTTLTAATVAEGKLTIGDAAYTATSVTGTDVKAGIYAASSLKYSDDVAGVDTFSDVGVVTYLVDGKRAVKVDTNNDKSFDDEIDLGNYGETFAIAKLGSKKLLTIASNVSADGSEVVLHFDDGSHGTHVAGIATGFESEGLQGVAPGAQVISAKIGDNRLSGGSTTTASMMLAIDWAVKQKADIINLSYGIRAGSNLGKSVIDQYIDKVAKESGVLFSISAGNEGPGLLTIGTPAAADLAITNGAYVSAQTAKDNYGYASFEDNTVWYFSSVGPRLDGGLKPTLLAPGSALSSVPPWAPANHANYRGTSMASPETTGGLALILSAARQKGLLGDRASVTRAVYDSAVNVPGLGLVEQGHGLLNVPAAVTKLSQMKASPIEYTVSVNNPVSPSGKGAGIFVRDPANADNLFTVSVAPLVPQPTALRTFKLVSAAWVKTPGSLWTQGPAAKTFQVTLDYAAISKTGVHSDIIKAVDEATNEVAFEVPVTVVVPVALNAGNQYRYQISQSQRVGQTLRHFIHVPAGTTSLALSLSSDGPVVWAQLLDSEGRKVAEVIDSEATSPMPTLSTQANLTRGGLYEIDVVAPATIRRPVLANLSVQLYSLQVTKTPSTLPGVFDVMVENRFAPVKVVPKVEIPFLKGKQDVVITGNAGNVNVGITSEDKKAYSKVEFTIQTNKALYDMMTDYPFRVFDSEGGMVASGGLELESVVALEKLEDLAGEAFRLEIQGAFTKAPPAKWAVHLTERRHLATPIAVMESPRLLIESGQFRQVAVDLSEVTVPTKDGLLGCAVLKLNSPEGKVIQSNELCD